MYKGILVDPDMTIDEKTKFIKERYENCLNKFYKILLKEGKIRDFIKSEGKDKAAIKALFDAYVNIFYKLKKNDKE